MPKKLNYQLKEIIITLSGTCFWYWNSYYGFLDSCSVPKALQKKYPKETFNKYDVMRNILNDLENLQKMDIINNIISIFYRLNNAVDRDNLDEKKAKKLLKEFKETVGSDPIEEEINKRQKQKERAKYTKKIKMNEIYASKIEELNKSFIELLTSKDITPQKADIY